jgi:hypothetical protein
MSMTRRDFEAIAQIISELKNDSLYSAYQIDQYKWIDSGSLIFKLGKYFRDQNPRFEFARFYNASKAKGEKC